MLLIILIACSKAPCGLMQFSKFEAFLSQLSVMWHLLMLQVLCCCCCCCCLISTTLDPTSDQICWALRSCWSIR